MVERHDDNILFNQAEQSKFSLAPVVNVTSALETAAGFTRAAKVMGDRSTIERDSTNRQTIIEGSHRSQLAYELGRFAEKITALCSDDEQLQFMIDHDGSAS